MNTNIIENAHSVNNQSFFDNEETQVYLFESLISPCVSVKQRARFHPTWIKILYHLFQLEKKVYREEWYDIHQNKESLAKGAKVSRKSITEFNCSEDSKIFMDIQRRPRKKGEKRFQSNVYKLKSWVINLFNFFEINGMMRGFRTDFQGWKKTFILRIRKWIIPRILKGLTLSQIFKNKKVADKLSTKDVLKGAADKSLKGAGIKISKEMYIKPSGFKSNTEPPPLPVVNDFIEISRRLSDRFKLKDGDINQLMNYVNVSHHKRAIGLAEIWIQRGCTPRSPAKFYQTCLNRTKLYKE